MVATGGERDADDPCCCVVLKYLLVDVAAEAAEDHLMEPVACESSGLRIRHIQQPPGHNGELFEASMRWNLPTSKVIFLADS